VSSQLTAFTDLLHTTLAREQELRGLRPQLVDGPDGPECLWATYERNRMHEKVNDLRADLGLPALPLEDILRVERQALGHSDYSRKFAFYCAELAVK
jgi:hypothetical protein